VRLSPSVDQHAIQEILILDQLFQPTSTPFLSSNRYLSCLFLGDQSSKFREYQDKVVGRVSLTSKIPVYVRSEAYFYLVLCQQDFASLPVDAQDPCWDEVGYEERSSDFGQAGRETTRAYRI
jgi:hypothetical protein